ncbi:hypothetical protein PRZ48_006311 [Zasmidium cellare]|uniref:AB hydrolase-1 domain-containing protein n=1 Tax=Zasmidium cellare TaxID=395010 RepID=A0ABR0ENR8_ZASCE|nr:hypothetical protein PRZ48_006311 [Zasmidium cellare]
MVANVPKLSVKDAQSKKQYTEVNGRKWYYIDSAPTTPATKGTIFLVHGFPDISYGWRYQIPLLNTLGFRTLALDCMGYSDTGTSPDLSLFGYKAHADAIAGIAAAIGVHKVIIGGHDWGGAVVYRVAQWHPSLITHVFSVCTPYQPPVERYISTETLSQTTLPQFGYQLQFGSEDGKVERVVRDEGRMRKFLLGMYGGRPSGRGKKFMSPIHGVDLGMVEEGEFGGSPLFEEEEFDFYVQEFMKNGINGPCNWYRTRKINWQDDLSLPAASKTGVKQPTLYILATKDEVLTREMSKSMEKAIPNLTRGEVPAGHWALWQTPEQVNGILKDWIEGVVLGGRSKL